MSTNPHEFGDPNRQGQYPPPPQWNSSQPEDNPAPAHYPPASQYPYPPASYPPPLNADHPYSHPPPPPSQYPPTSHMATIHPHVQGTQDPYRLPPPPGAYRPQDVYAQPAPPPQPQVVYQAAAPRQRTAIACRYCRRRKIRCSGFESSQDGRCSNCIRFNQECMFTPVSSQAQAFVPAHAAYPHLRNPQNGRAASPPADSTLPPPQGMYQHPYGTAPPPLASAVPADHRPAGRRGSGSGFEYPDPTNLAPHDRRPSPQSAYPYDSRHSSSPHSSPYPPLHTAPTAMTPPPTSTPGGSVSSSRGGLNVRDMLNPGDSQGRSSTDSDMLNALNRRGLNQ
ncbi:uncharacterized protein P174DRAFT_459575 [Aspergillus novofumigatus IBT 16806]|uniref:Zn(2)-C6 fungal-type domain-containing protein n=1 Tax=Aspergillus novofumigatus (strain IBT 16806) TaxID=1392255 RepID=A0A2I1CEQ8_ASPN1|nr:uncharacterized protein P174DRAFT_459575 [Aspergillus novofumigatus IBT 16806]PKX96109.1 hypothetical protein P174DRAFT_459575 [Aspergillus novofumigatus IBT 16806]